MNFIGRKSSPNERKFENIFYVWYHVFCNVRSRDDLVSSQSSSCLADTPDKILREHKITLKTVKIETNKQATY